MDSVVHGTDKNKGVVMDNCVMHSKGKNGVSTG
jgi:hypothetical protein